jgi:hypothetical protein
MMSGRIYLLEENGTLQSLSEKPYTSEDLLQTLLENYPDLLAGEQIDEAAPRRWLLVSREVGVPGEENGAGRWSLDHLFLDQDAVPTLVEVKRSSDTRVRREVVGQMLDYAANAVVYWPVETVRAKFEAACESRWDDPAQLVAELIESDFDDDAAVEAFWSQVKTNLRAGRLRLVFVADGIPPELKRVVEFLNEQMDPAEVLAVEIRQYVGEGLKTLVPRVIGQTAEAQVAKSSAGRTKKRWDEPSFFQELEARHSVVEVNIARKILEWAHSRTTRVWWGRGSRNGSFVPVLDHKGSGHSLFAVWTYGTVEIYFYWYQYKPPFDSEEKRRELLNRLNAIAGVSLPDDAIARRPGIPLSALKDEPALKQFFEILDWVVQEIQAA